VFFAYNYKKSTDLVDLEALFGIFELIASKN